MIGNGLRADTAVFLVVAGAAISLQLAFQPGLATQLMLLGPLVAVLGIPHGALDRRVAQRLWPLEGPPGMLFFGLGYMSIVALVLGAWVVTPSAALIAFVAYSAIHFAGDWRDDLGPLPRFIAGILVVSLPAFVWPEGVTQVFAALAPHATAAAIADTIQVLTPLSAAALAIALWRADTVKPSTLYDFVGLIVLALLAPPLLYFIVYFCFLHSPRHFIDTTRRLGLGLRSGVVAAAPLTLMTWGMAGVAVALLVAADVSTDDTTLKVVFIGLAALAVPHMVLVGRFWTRHRARPAAGLKRARRHRKSRNASGRRLRA